MSDSDAKTLVARNLRQLLALSEIKQSELAVMLGISRTTVSCWCAGTKTPRMDKIQAMAEIFGVPVSDFFSEEPPTFTVIDAKPELMMKDFLKLDDDDQREAMRYVKFLLSGEKYQGKNKA